MARVPLFAATEVPVLSAFLSDQRGQDFVEYSLLLAAVCLGSAAIILSMGPNINLIWTAVNSRLTSAGN